MRCATPALGTADSTAGTAGEAMRGARSADDAGAPVPQRSREAAASEITQLIPRGKGDVDAVRGGARMRRRTPCPSVGRSATAPKHVSLGVAQSRPQLPAWMPNTLELRQPRPVTSSNTPHLFSVALQQPGSVTPLYGGSKIVCFGHDSSRRGALPCPNG